MALTAFTSNFEDNSTDAGFQFTFFCDICREGYKTEFTEAKSYKKGRFLRGLGGFRECRNSNDWEDLVTWGMGYSKVQAF